MTIVEKYISFYDVTNVTAYAIAVPMILVVEYYSYATCTRYVSKKSILIDREVQPVKFSPLKSSGHLYTLMDYIHLHG